MSSLARSRSSISKHRGAAMSSRLIPPYAGAMRRDDLDDLLGVLRVEYHRPGVHPAEALEQRRLALHHRQRGGRPDVAQPQYRRAVADHGDRVAFDGQPAGVVRVLRDRQADPGNPRRVRPGQLVPVAQRDFRRYLDLAAQVEQEGTVGDLADVDARKVLQGRDHLVGVAASAVSQVTSAISETLSESTTSSAVTIAPDSPTQVVSRPMAEASAGTETRTVMEKPALGRARMGTLAILRRAGRPDHAGRSATSSRRARPGPPAK